MRWKAMTDLDNYILYLEEKYENLRKGRNVVCGVEEEVVRKILLIQNAKIKTKMQHIKKCIDSAKSFKDNTDKQ